MFKQGDRDKIDILQKLYVVKLDGKNGIALIVSTIEQNEFYEMMSDLIERGYVKEVESYHKSHRAFAITDLGIGAVWFGLEDADKILTMA